jgi:hypothetical protein
MGILCFIRIREKDTIVLTIVKCPYSHVGNSKWSIGKISSRTRSKPGWVCTDVLSLDSALKPPYPIQSNGNISNYLLRTYMTAMDVKIYFFIWLTPKVVKFGQSEYPTVSCFV